VSIKSKISVCECKCYIAALVSEIVSTYDFVAISWASNGFAALEIFYPFIFKVEVGAAISSSLVAFTVVLKSEISVTWCRCPISVLDALKISTYYLLTAS
jgi:hypothetical protein